MVYIHDGVLLSGKHSDILKYAGNCIELENIILYEVTQTQTDKHGMYSFISRYQTKPSIISLWSTTSEKLSNKENCKKDIYGSPWEGEIYKIF